MSRENVEIVKRAFEAFERSDFDAILRMCDEAIVIRQPRELPGAPETQHGHTGVLEAFELWPQQWDDYGIEVLYVRDVGDHVVAHARNWGRGKTSGIELETLFTSVFTFARGKVVEWQFFMREEEALEAVGLRESAMSRENEELVRNAYDAWNRDDLEAQLAMLHPEFEHVTSGLFPGLAPIYRGHAGWRDFWRDFRQIWESLRIEIEDLREVGDEQYVALLTFEARSRNGLTVRRQFGNVLSVRDGLAARVQAFSSWAAALEAVGLRE